MFHYLEENCDSHLIELRLINLNVIDICFLSSVISDSSAKKVLVVFSSMVNKLEKFIRLAVVEKS